VITRDPDSGWVNWGNYRAMVHDSKSLGCSVSPRQHIGMHYQKYEALGRPMEFAITLGTVPLIGIVELLAHVRQTRDVATDDDWRAARENVAKGLHAEDLLIFAPKWVEPIGRRWMQSDLATMDRMTFADASRYKRAIEVSIRGKHREELAGWKSAQTDRFGGVEVTTWENPAYSPVIDDPLDVSRMRVSYTQGGGGVDRECGLEHTAPQTAGTYFPPGMPIPGARFNCGNALVAVTVLSALDYSGRRCVVGAPAQGMRLRVRFSNVKLGKALHGNHGLYAEHERTKTGAPVTIDLSVGGKPVGRATHRDGDGWSYFEIPTNDLAGQTADVLAEISSTGGDRSYCFEVTSR
jgi:hypothetical protein